MYFTNVMHYKDNLNIMLILKDGMQLVVLWNNVTIVEWCLLY